MDDNLFTWTTDSTSLDELEKGIKLAQINNAQSLLLLTCSDNNYPEQVLNAVLQDSTIPVFGGIYPMITHHGCLIKQGALVIGFYEHLETTVFSTLDQVNDEEALEELINARLAAKNNLVEQDNFLMFYDGLMTNIEDFIDCLFECLDHTITIAGGGAGNLDFIQRPSIYTNIGIQHNVVQLVSLPSKLSTSVAHGWKTFKGPFLASETQGQTVKSINYRPAFEVYSQTIEKEGRYKFNTDNFFDIAKHFPLGIEDINGDFIVRDPILTTNNDLQCVGKVPINSMVYLLKGDFTNLISAAEEAAEEVFIPLKNSAAHVSIVFDCISRVLYMEDEFTKELSAIKAQCHLPSLFGVLSIGEIANNKSGAISLLNKSTVISAW